MNSSFGQDPSNGDRGGPFVGLVAVLVALLVANTMQSLNLINQRGDLLEAEKRIATMLPEARLLQSQIEPRLEQFSRDLVQMSSTNETSKQLVNHFGISWTPNTGAETNKTASPAASGAEPTGRGR